MKRRLAAAGLAFALSAPAAHATDYGDLLCHLHDIAATTRPTPSTAAISLADVDSNLAGKSKPGRKPTRI
jgi:hypothetical protein